jgi:DNA-binding response OmpR family regulator
LQQQPSLSPFVRILLVDDDVAAVQLTAIALEESSVRAQLSTAGGMREAMGVLSAAARGL